MILYFSATGNCEFVAHKMAEAICDRAISMEEVSGKIVLEAGEPLGIVTPTYFWGLPTFVDDFFGTCEISNGTDSYIYYIATYGTTPGQTDYFMAEHLKRQGLVLSASYSIKTVDNWTVWFDLSDREKVRQLLAAEQEQLAQVTEAVREHRKTFIRKGKMPLWLSRGAKFFYDVARKTSHFKVNEDCIGCGLCAKACPVEAIAVKEGKPAWVLDRCTMCLKCLHNCPAFAIEYGKNTKKHGQYRHPKA